MDRVSSEVLATTVAAEIVQAHKLLLDESVLDDLAARIKLVLDRATRQERDACVAVCLQRLAMWEATENRSTISEPLRAESRARTNEAQVIADALRAR